MNYFTVKIETTTGIITNGYVQSKVISTVPQMRQAYTEANKNSDFVRRVIRIWKNKTGR